MARTNLAVTQSRFSSLAATVNLQTRDLNDCLNDMGIYHAPFSRMMILDDQSSDPLSLVGPPVLTAARFQVPELTRARGPPGRPPPGVS
eukprot:561936-Hanusia_phi.AAC.1